MILGITGGIASGKSTVTRTLADLGAVAISADEIAHTLMAPGAPLTQSILQAFGPEYALPSQSVALDRRKLGQFVFHNSEARARLQELTHPPIMAEMGRRAEEAQATHPQALVAAEIPLLYEANLTDFCDKTLVVSCREETQISRLRARNPELPGAEILGRLHSQMPLGEKVKRADYVISSEQPLDAMRAEVRRLFDSLTRRQV